MCKQSALCALVKMLKIMDSFLKEIFYNTQIIVLPSIIHKIYHLTNDNMVQNIYFVGIIHVPCKKHVSNTLCAAYESVFIVYCTQVN